jgi:multiple sugar transport system substrate-binding protein/sn-glycerol 3-phosphate transport system substrate-binding protein
MTLFPAGRTANPINANSKIAPEVGLAWVFGLVLFLAACGGTPTARPTGARETLAITDAPQATRPANTRTTTPEPAASLGIEPGALQGATIEFWHAWPGAVGEAIRASVEAFNANNDFGITVVETYQGNYNNLYDQINSAISAGSLPDLVAGYPYQLLEWEAALADLAPYTNDPDWGLAAGEQADFIPVFWEQDLHGDRRIGFPAQRSAYLLYYNRTWARELGFESPPANPQALKEQACAAARANNADADPENDGTGGWIVNTTPVGIMSWLYAFGSEVAAQPGEGYEFNTPQTAAALSYLKDLYDSSCAWKVRKSDAGEGFAEGEFVEAEFAARQALFISGSLADLPYQTAALQEAGNADEWTVIAFPSRAEQPAVLVYGPSLGIFESSTEKQLAAWLLIRWLASPAEQARFIAASGTFPTRAAALDELEDYASEHLQWAAAFDLLPYARTEPDYESWGVVRWVVGDVGTQVFRSYFTADRIPATLELMDETANELHRQTR